MSWIRDSKLASTLLDETKAEASQITYEAAQTAFTPENGSRLARRVNRLVDQKLNMLKDEPHPNVCKKGCCECCYSPVPSTFIEIMAIAEKIKKEWKPKDISKLVERLKVIVNAFSKDFDLWADRYHEACPLLVNGECSVYEVRPVWCRTATSWDKEMCTGWKSSFVEFAEIPSVHGERLIGEAAQEGVSSLIPDSGVRLPLAYHLLARFEPTAMPGPTPRPAWLPALPPKKPVVDADLLSFYKTRDADPWPPTLERTSLARSLVCLDIPFSFHKVGEHEEAMKWYVDQIAHLEQTDFKGGVAEAYDAVEQMRFARIWYSREYPKEVMSRLGDVFEAKIARPLAPELLEPLGKRRPGKPRVGFISSRLGRHSGSSWAIGWLKNLDKNALETYAINAGGKRDHVSIDFRFAADHFYQLDGDRLSTARFIRDLDLDYLIFTDIGDGGGNLQLAMFRLARTQATSWGCPFTSGMPQVDEYLSSELWEHPGSDVQYREKLIRLPLHGVTYARPNYLLKHLTRKDFGLPDGHLVCIGQNLAKWRPEDDDLVAELSSRLKNPLYIFTAGSQQTVECFMDRMLSRHENIRYMPRAHMPVFLRLTSMFDMTLDAPVFHGGHSSFAFMGGGTPIISLEGDQLRSRMGVAFQTVAGIPETVVKTTEEYLQKASDPDFAQEMKRNLRLDDLFDNPIPARALSDHILKTCAVQS